ncbi:MAG: hypothetical protein IPK15_02740 [Verrucomicrobia bacterium]|nr:hypothetical protein [Verrucomicrobiota bacterium]
MKWPVVWIFSWALLSVVFGGTPASAQTTIVPTGSTWRYLDTGVDAGTAWRNVIFDDSAWLAGPAQLGFSSNPPENDEATVISHLTEFGEPITTFYFRHTFEVPNADLYTNLMVRLRRDDGAIVYLNGIEVFRSNMPLGPVDFTTLAALAQDDGTSLFAGPADLNALFTGTNVLAVEVHQNALSSTDVSFDLELLGNVTFEKPAVAIQSPADRAVIGSPTVVLFANASDTDGVIAQVDFMDGTEFLGSVTNAPFVFTNFNTSVGTHSFTAIAIDSTGLSSTSAPVVITIVPAIVPSRSEWRYLDDGSEPPAEWNTAAFDDSGWSNGIAQLGFGEGDETTLIRRSSELSGTNILAFYFRHRFEVSDPAAISSLTVRLLRDDGGIVYLNGTEIFRNNMPAGPVNSSTLAAAIAEDAELRATRVNPQLLVAGENLIAVEIHQVNITSSDISFDLELLPNLASHAPQITITSPSNDTGLLGPTDVTAEALATDVDDAIASVSFYLDGRLTATISEEPYAFEFEDLVGNHTIRAVATDSLGLSSTSAPVNIGIASTVSLIATGAVWRYSDIGGDQGTNWRRLDFDDSAWLSGAGKLGTNDSPTTVIRIRNANNQQINTSYYRHQFGVTNLASITNLAFRVLRDDGCLAYLNGVEIFRMNMPTGTVTFNTLSPVGVAGADESTYFTTNISPALLIEGLNVLAVELHQSSGTSDAGFDLGLRGITIPPVVCPPLSISHVGPDVRISWTGEGFILQESDRPEGPYTNRPSLSSPHLVSPPLGNRFFRLTRP